MRARILLVMLILMSSSIMLVEASPKVLFTFTSVESKTVLHPVINSEVSDYKWTITGKDKNYYSETEWIPHTFTGDHTSILDSGTYLIVMTGRNVTTGETNDFSVEMGVSVKNNTVTLTQKQSAVVAFESHIINSLPEPLKSFFLKLSGFEIGLVILGFLLLMAIATRRKKVKKYMELTKWK